MCFALSHIETALDSLTSHPSGRSRQLVLYLLSSKRKPHFKTHKRSWNGKKKWPWVPTGPETKNGCPGKRQQQITAVLASNSFSHRFVLVDIVRSSDELSVSRLCREKHQTPQHAVGWIEWGRHLCPYLDPSHVLFTAMFVHALLSETACQQSTPIFLYHYLASLRLLDHVTLLHVAEVILTEAAS
jgi:hypothetical protein